MARARPSTTMRLVRRPPLARCMYCLTSGAPRTEEHLIPRALGGRLTLRDAVCEPCRRSTGRFEQATLDRDFGVPKTLLALKRRRARGDGPARLPAVDVEGEAAGSLTPETFPRGFWLPTFERAGLLSVVAPSHGPPCTGFIECRLDLGRPTRHAVAAPPPLADPGAYAHAIAKWAYALAVAERGLDCCDAKPMRDLLLGRRADVFAFVGTPSPRASASREWLHDVHLDETGPWLTATLALFAAAGMTPYEIVIGRLHGR